jgi:4'-phosphopantetheinyl transferase
MSFVEPGRTETPDLRSAAAAVHVWLVDLDADAVDDAACWLSADECERARRFVHAHDRRWYQRSHAVLRTLLANRLRRRPDQIAYRAGPAGKPELTDHPLQFSLAHCHGRAAVAITADHCVGVDVETPRPINGVADLARECLSRDEYRQFGALADGDCSEAFLVAWTRKEAVLKALGTGLLRPPAAIDAGFTAGARRIAVDELPVCIATRITPHCIASVATCADAHEVRWQSTRWCDVMTAAAGAREHASAT